MRTRLGRAMIILALAAIGCAACGLTAAPTIQQATVAPAPTPAATTAPTATAAPTTAPAATVAPSSSGAAGNTGCSDTAANAQAVPSSRVKISHTSALTQSVVSADPSEKGERLIVTGTVFAADCTPLAGVAIQVWHTNADGVYGPGQGANEDQCCYFGGELETDSTGRYAFETIKPAPYKDEASPPPAHIHFKLSHPNTGDFETEMLFKDDPHLGAGSDPALVVELSTEAASDGSSLHGVFDIVMPSR